MRTRQKNRIYASIIAILAMMLATVSWMTVSGKYTIIYQSFSGQVVFMRGWPRNAHDIELEGYLVLPLTVLLVIATAKLRREQKKQNKKG